jgi:hypothetical protein
MRFAWVDHRVRKETALASGKLDKGEPGAKLKKRAKVLVELMANDIMGFLDFL